MMMMFFKRGTKIPEKTLLREVVYPSFWTSQVLVAGRNIVWNQPGRNFPQARANHSTSKQYIKQSSSDLGRCWLFFSTTICFGDFKQILGHDIIYRVRCYARRTADAMNELKEPRLMRQETYHAGEPWRAPRFGWCWSRFCFCFFWGGGGKCFLA